MNNRERFVRTINWQPVDRILTYDLLDNSDIRSLPSALV